MYTCTFTGHRPSSFIFGYNEEHPLCRQIKGALLELSRRLYQEENVRTFYSGCALATDLWGAEAVLYLRDSENLPDIKLICAIPYPNHQANWPVGQKRRLKRILSAANETVTVCERYSQEAYKQRNYYMIDNSWYLIAVFDRSKRQRSGTLQTVNRAERNGLKIVYINPNNALVTY